jgi:hypothetical protein
LMMMKRNPWIKVCKHDYYIYLQIKCFIWPNHISRVEIECSLASCCFFIFLFIFIYLFLWHWLSLVAVMNECLWMAFSKFITLTLTIYRLSL